MFSLSNRKFSLCQFTYTKLSRQTYPASGKKWKFSRQISQYHFPLESGNLQLEQTKFPVFSLCIGKISKFPVFSLTGIFFWSFSLFSLCRGYPVKAQLDYNLYDLNDTHCVRGSSPPWVSPPSVSRACFVWRESHRARPAPPVNNTGLVTSRQVLVSDKSEM